MGDVAMSVPVIRALVNQHPEVKVTVLSKPFLQPISEDIPNVSFYAADVKGKHKGVLGLYRLYRELKGLNITHIADFHNVLRSKILRCYFKLTSAKIAFIDKGRAEKKALTREHNKVFKQLKTSVQRYTDVLNTLGFQTSLENPKAISKKVLSQKLNEFVGVKKSSWVGVAPFAAFEGKKYPLHLMKEVIAQLSESHQIFLFGGGQTEIAILNEWGSEFQNTINIAGKISFQEELALISNLDVMLSMDSGNAHLAAMQQVKTVTLWGVTHPYAGFAPFNQPESYCILPDLEVYPKIPCSVYGNNVFDGYDRAMETISPSIVMQKINEVLKNKKEP